MPRKLSRQQVVDAIIEALNAQFDRFQGAAANARSLGNDDESRAEDKYDTRSTEANYLADGQSRLAASLLESLATYRGLALPKSAGKIAMGSLVHLSMHDDSVWFFMGPVAGGLEVKCGKVEVTVITPESPIGTQLMGLSVGGKTHAPAARVLEIF